MFPQLWLDSPEVFQFLLLTGFHWQPVVVWPEAWVAPEPDLVAIECKPPSDLVLPRAILQMK
jgi:hypothetical protein